MKDLILKIKIKKPLDRLDDDFVKDFIEGFLRKNAKIKKKFYENKLKKKDLEKIVKGVRNDLNKFYGQFWLNNKLELGSHRSARERLQIYGRLYKFIFSITGRPEKILDLACGLNPLTYNLIGKEIYFIATELTDYDCNSLRDYFRKKNIIGEVIKADLRYYRDFPEADVCFMFKVFDSLESNGHRIAEDLIKCIKAKYIVVSFSTTNIKGKRMNYPRRGWFEIMLKRLGLDFVKHEEHNEIFYIVKK